MGVSVRVCVVWQDVAQHTRIQPNQRDLIFKKFVEKVNKTTKVSFPLPLFSYVCVCVCVCV